MILSSAIGLFVGALIIYLLCQQRISALSIRLRLSDEQLQRMQGKEEELVQLKMHLAVLEERLTEGGQSKEKIEEVLKGLCLESLERNSRSFLELAKVSLEKYQEQSRGELDRRCQTFAELVGPVKESLTKLDLDMKNLEKERKGEQEVVKEQLRALTESERLLRQETSSLVKALKSPSTRGRWGEMQLRRVVEIAGMLSHCDFYEQKTFEGEEKVIRPDLIVKLPGGRQVIVDAKAPLDAYLDAMNLMEESQKQEKLKEHAKQVRAHLISLGKKAYWEQLEMTPEFVVLFLPSETFFSAALESDPSLIEVGANHKVILATPTTLIALLKTVAYGWKEETLSRHVEQVSSLAGEMYKRLCDLAGSWSRMGKALSQSVEAYNKAVGSLESRVLVTGRKFKELGIAPSEADIEELIPIEKVTRSLQAQELLSEQEEGL